MDRNEKGQFIKGNKPWNKKDKIKKICNNCSKKFKVKPSRKDTAKYCSRECSYNSEERNNKISNKNKGREFSEEHKKKLSKIKKENFKDSSNHPRWLGPLSEVDNYFTAHKRKRDIDGNPERCIDCGKKGKKVNGRWNIDWSSETHEYNSIDEFVGRCRKCHGKHTIKLNKQKKQ